MTVDSLFPLKIILGSGKLMEQINNFSFPRHRKLVEVRKVKHHHVCMSYIPTESFFFYLQQIYLIEVVTLGTINRYSQHRTLSTKTQLQWRIAELTLFKSSQDSNELKKGSLKSTRQNLHKEIWFVLGMEWQPQTHTHTHSSKSRSIRSWTKP